MASVDKSSAFSALSGQVGKQLVFKKYGNKTVVSAYPDMSKVKPSKLQKAKRNIFKEAVAYAQEINNNAALKKKYQKKVKKGQTVYHFAIQEFLKKHKERLLQTEREKIALLEKMPGK